MATPPLTADVIEQFLEIATACAADLQVVAGEWDAWSRDDQLDFALEWDHLMADYLSLLDDWYRVGLLTAGQEARYRAVLHDLCAALPVIERLNLYRPPVDLAPATP